MRGRRKGRGGAAAQEAADRVDEKVAPEGNTEREPTTGADAATHPSGGEADMQAQPAIASEENVGGDVAEDVGEADVANATCADPSPPGEKGRGTSRAAAETAAPPPEPAISPAEARIARAAELMAAGNPVAAVEQYTAALNADPVSVPAMQGLGTAHLAQAQYDAAEKEFRKAIRLAPNHLEINHQLGLTLFRRGVYAGAATQLRRVIELDRDYAPAHIVLGEALNQIGDTEAAIMALERAIELQPESGKAFYALGIAYDRKGQHERAAEMYRRSREVGGR